MLRSIKGIVKSIILKISDIKLFKKKALAKELYSMGVRNVISLCDKDVEGIKQLLVKYLRAVNGYDDSSDNISKIIPFSSEKKYSAVEFKNTGTLVFGAYKVMVNKEETSIEDRIKQLSKAGMREVFFGWSTRPLYNDQLPDDIQILGVVLMTDKI